MTEQIRKKKRPGQYGADDILEVREKRVMFKVSYSEFEKLNALYEASGYPTFAKFCRDKALHDAIHTNAKDVKKMFDEAKSLSAYQNTQIKRLGNNINQIAKRVNSGDVLSRLTLDFKKQLDEFKLIKEEYLKELKKIKDKK